MEADQYTRLRLRGAARLGITIAVMKPYEKKPLAWIGDDGRIYQTFWKQHQLKYMAQAVYQELNAVGKGSDAVDLLLPEKKRQIRRNISTAQLTPLPVEH